MRKAIKFPDELHRLAFLPKGKRLPKERAWQINQRSDFAHHC